MQSPSDAIDDPLLKVPPARRGNRTGALLGSPARRGNRTGALLGSPARRGNRGGAPLAVPLAKRGEPKGGGAIVNSALAIGITVRGANRLQLRYASLRGVLWGVAMGRAVGAGGAPAGRRASAGDACTSGAVRAAASGAALRARGDGRPVVRRPRDCRGQSLRSHTRASSRWGLSKGLHNQSSKGSLSENSFAGR